ncbi:MAG: GspE/PulE family protein [Cyclobacteriaceae bacterium]
MITTLVTPLKSEILQCVSNTQAQTYRIIPIARNADRLEVLVEQELFNLDLKCELELLLNLEILPQFASKALISDLLARYYRRASTAKGRTLHVSTSRMDSFIEDLVKEAKDIGCSDIHLEASEVKCRIRLRIDGHLIEKYEFQKDQYPSLINKIKVRANLDIAEKRMPQDGRIQYRHHGDAFDIRVSVLPTLNSEKVVLRILHQDESRLDLEGLGLSNLQLKLLVSKLKVPEGIILISGPTGSGKTTTLYSALKTLNSERVNICTVEDPIEYTIEGINQVQVREGIGLSFAEALRSFLRQDPDIIMLGEIRDAETAQMALRASLTGHKVLSTIHTNSAVETITRLLDMGVPGFLIASTLTLSIAQRLVRRLCENCKEVLDRADVKLVNNDTLCGSHELYKATGCEQCYMTGYKGRIAIYEVLGLDDRMKAAIRAGEGLYDVIPNDYKTLKIAAIDLLKKGETSLEEVTAFL